MLDELSENDANGNPLPGNSFGRALQEKLKERGFSYDGTLLDRAFCTEVKALVKVLWDGRPPQFRLIRRLLQAIVHWSCNPNGLRPQVLLVLAVLRKAWELDREMTIKEALDALKADGVDFDLNDE